MLSFDSFSLSRLLWGKDKKVSDLTDLEVLQRYQAIFAKIPLPINTNHYETKKYLESLESNGLFLKILAQVFGPLQSHSDAGTSVAKGEQAKQYWMDKTWVQGNRKDSAAYAEALYELLKPEAPFAKLLLHVSQPSPSFLSTLQSKWRTTGLETVNPSSSSGGEHNYGDTEMEYSPMLAETYPVPLGLLWNQASHIYAMPADTDLVGQSENKVPGMLLVPFWHPPMETRQVHHAGPPRACLPCSMGSYFLLRMLGYLTMRSAGHRDTMMLGSKDVFTKPGQWKGNKFKLPTKAPTSVGNAFAILKDVAGVVDGRYLWKTLEYAAYSTLYPSAYEEPTSQLPPVFTKLFKSYLQAYASPPGLAGSVISHKPYPDLSWNASETLGALLLHAPIHMWLKRKDVTVVEYKRTATQQHDSVIITLFSLPYLELIWRQVSLEGDSGKTASSSGSNGADTGKAGSKARGENTNSNSALEMHGGRRKNCQFTAIDKLGRNGQQQHSSTAGSGSPEPKTAGAIVVDSQLFVYREALGTLRQVMISLPTFPSYTCTHLKSLLSLWHSLLYVAPGGGQDLASLLARRYEAYSNILIDFFNFSKGCNLVSRANVEVLVELTRVFGTFRSTQTLEWLRTVSGQIQREQSSSSGNGASPISTALKAQFSLTWVDEDEAIGGFNQESFLFAVTSAEMAQRAFRTIYYPLKLRLKRHQEEGPSGDTYTQQLQGGPADYEKCLQAIGDCLNHMEAVFPGIAECKMAVGGSRGDTGRYDRGAASDQYDEMYGGSAQGGLDSAEVLPTFDQKDAYLRGVVSCGVHSRHAALSRIKFQPGATDTGDISQAGGGGATHRTSMSHYKRPIQSNEMPLLVHLTMYLDVALNWTAKKVAPGRFPASLIPRCDHCDHHLEVDPHQNSSCCIQSEQPGAWYCAYCALSYSAAVKGVLCDAKGVLVTKSHTRPPNPSGGRWADEEDTHRGHLQRQAAKMCCRCRLMLPVSSTVHIEYAPNVHVCADCLAATPMLSVRLLANTDSWCLLLLGGLVYFNLWTILAVVYSLLRFVLGITGALLSVVVPIPGL